MWRDALSRPDATGPATSDDGARRRAGPPTPGGARAVDFAGERLLVWPAGVVTWPRESTLFVADLHLEKASWYASRGRPLPPYDSAETLARLGHCLAAHRPRRVVCLGDSFHDACAATRLGPAERALLDRLVADHDWHWVLGNHDPALPADLGGRAVQTLDLAPLVCRHAAEPGAVAELSGHYHPKVRLRTAGGTRAHRCALLTPGRHLILPAFGAFTGGLDVTDRAFAPLLSAHSMALALGRARVVATGLAG
ncbi:putative phosphoesterase [Rhodothalassium salexigens DSM 2132]|uniref:Putative phosphoesterase n=1 Tax=Rhodothalassium salexigens DSM 2132 TaxID=1188247 RepID=A0A4R2PQ11_RHOSA|nr:ligase-associated DNA damage response endonuclease PdeM [Rhodothalassium salexigens]MBB4210564.1 hypothetical protein [Rhodothalassium salexigens DSM 2132]MBK1639990.1 hypothetical protein [Rhodothalassium salexigens DSM 2132]TCP37879.1 putative phosphoesterase [Rhodothalassium salexigens DSM 2132]